ncbi:MAG: AMP-binding protein, partial [Ottowia sp.]|nr:AMP-binding protein [Ottowia sp.]
MSAQPAASHARGTTDTPLIEQTIGAFFDAMVERFPEREALVVVHQGRRYSYRQLQQASRQLASALLKLGLTPGDRVGIWSHNNAEWVLMQLATAMTGLVLVNINPAYRTAEVEYALNKVGCQALVVMPRFKTSDYLGMLRELAPEWAHAKTGEPLQSATLPHLNHAIWIDVAGEGAEEPGFQRFSDLMQTGDAADPRLAQTARLLHNTDAINI